jgi:hypothetical protein
MNTYLINTLLAGAIIFAAWLVALFFWTFWKKSRDRLFAFFAAAFLLLGIERLCLAFWAEQGESYFYLIRLGAFLMIIYAIIDKNRSSKGP